MPINPVIAAIGATLLGNLLGRPRRVRPEALPTVAPEFQPLLAQLLPQIQAMIAQRPAELGGLETLSRQLQEAIAYSPVERLTALLESAMRPVFERQQRRTLGQLREELMGAGHVRSGLAEELLRRSRQEMEQQYGAALAEQITRLTGETMQQQLEAMRLLGGMYPLMEEIRMRPLITALSMLQAFRPAYTQPAYAPGFLQQILPSLAQIWMLENIFGRQPQPRPRTPQTLPAVTTARQDWLGTVPMTLRLFQRR